MLHVPPMSGTLFDDPNIIFGTGRIIYEICGSHSLALKIMIAGIWSVTPSDLEGNSTRLHGVK
jgi:hypothetical protein